MDGRWKFAEAVVPRAVVLGAIAGVGIGGAVGTAIVPIVGTVAGGFVGAVGGVLGGTASGLVIAVSMASSAGVVTVRILGALMAGGCALLEALALFGHATGPGQLILLCAVLTMVSGAVGAWLGPLTAFPGNPASPDRILGRAMGICAAAGCSVGALGGLVLGLYAYPPTAPAALVEGAVFGGMCGVVLGFWAGLVQCVMRVAGSRRRVPR